MGSGVDDMVFLRDRSDAIGEHSVISGSASKSGGGKSVSRQKSSSRTIDAASLRSLPRGRAVMFAAGTKPVLLRTVPWMEGPHADKVLASIAAHDPTAPSTFEDLRDQGAITPKKLEIALEEYEEAHDAQPSPGVRLNK